MTAADAKTIIRTCATEDAAEGTLPSSLGYHDVVQTLSLWSQGDADVAEALRTLHGTGAKGMHWVAVDTYEAAAR